MAKKEIMNVASESDIAVLKESFPTERGNSRISLPRIGMYSQDKFEGKGKAAKLVEEAGVFYTEKPGEELNEAGKPIWEKTELGKTIEAIILFKRYKLTHFETSLGFTSSPVYDSQDEILPLFRDKKEVDKGTIAELKARKEYQGKTAKGKPTSKLEDKRVLYLLYKGEAYQMELGGSSKYSYLTYEKSTLPPSVLTKFSSEAKENGAVAWNQMTFIPIRPLNGDEATDVVARVTEIKETIVAEKSQYVTQSAEDKNADEEFVKKF